MHTNINVTFTDDSIDGPSVVCQYQFQRQNLEATMTMEGSAEHAAAFCMSTELFGDNLSRQLNNIMKCYGVIIENDIQIPEHPNTGDWTPEEYKCQATLWFESMDEVLEAMGFYPKELKDGSYEILPFNKKDQERMHLTRS